MRSVRRLLSVGILILITVFLGSGCGKNPVGPDPTPTPTPLPDTVIPPGSEVYESPKLIGPQRNSTIPLEYPAGCFKIMPTLISPGRGSIFLQRRTLLVAFFVDICSEAPIVDDINEFELRVKSYDSGGNFVGFLGTGLRVPGRTRSPISMQAYTAPISDVPPFIYSIGTSFYSLQGPSTPTPLSTELDRSQPAIVRFIVDWRRGY